MFSFILVLWTVLFLASQELKHLRNLNKLECIVYGFTNGHVTAAVIGVLIVNYVILFGKYLNFITSVHTIILF